MDSMNFKKVQFAKANAIYKYHQRRRIASFFRFLEVCVVVFLISRLSISIQFPSTVKNPSEYFRGVSGFVVSPRFVFLIGNVIIITLFVKSGQFGSRNGASTSPSYNLYEEFIQNSVNNQITHHEITKLYGKQSLKTEFNENQSRKTEFNANQSLKTEFNENQSMKTEETVTRLEVKEYRRSHSQVENFSYGKSEKPAQVLRRSETENCGKRTLCPCSENSAKCSYPEDDLSNEDFRRTVEAFIARQQKSLRK